ncbi:hypothetical protein [Nonomuraea dietziae]|uniref:hypothetical protein n=1 Tax=Nonomuraea dietziae TaxID=65515 RepID=UPI0031E13D29
MPDGLLTQARAMLAEGDLAYLPDALTMAAVELGVPLTAQEVEILRDLFVALGIEGEPTGVDQVAITDTTRGTGHRFSPVSPEVAQHVRVPAALDLTAEIPAELADLQEELVDLTDHLVVDALSEHAGTRAIWRTWRSGPERLANEDVKGWRRVYLAEVEPGVLAWELTLEAQTELTQMSESDPQVEVYWSSEELPPYHRAAREAATLLWKRR